MVEVNLCGHATLASAYVIFEILGHEDSDIIFQSKSGELKVSRKEDMFELNFPASEIKKCKISKEIVATFGKEPIEVWKSDDYMLVYENETDIRSLSPNMSLLESLDCRGAIVTSKGNDFDFVSRFFAPGCGVNEDPVTGSAHCALVPYWAKRLGKTKLSAAQLSSRGGKLQCELIDDRVLMAGKAVKYLQGTIYL